ncbi:MAG: XRE family transcriptional regulator [Candidatus Omnitrophica bacterium]|nr:XRE family transcriptional regulator [Candidatus Omnitrophota bacterium]MBU4457138.1 XRE family transcriptional regulator [Candidatus Omnitrophota bacterium]
MMDRLIIIGERLKRAREALGLTQEEVAAKLEIGRPRYSGIENGKRDIPLKDLYRFAEFYGRPIDYFIKETLLTDSGFKVLFRKTEGDEEVARVVTEFENLCEKMCELESISEITVRSPINPDYQFERNREWYWGKHYADIERKQLDLGQAPLRNLSQLLEEKRSLKIFYLPIPPERGIYGMFTYDQKMGGCVLINSNPNSGNQLFSLAHEYAHFVFHKEKLGIISTEEERNSTDEKVANSFASNFLIPEDTLRDLFNMRIKEVSDLKAEDVVYLADYFGVSFTTMVYRLNNLKLITDDIKDELINYTWVTSVRESMGISEPERSRSKFPTLYLHLAIKAFQQGKLTTAKLADFLEIPLYQAMDLGRKLRGSIQDGSGDSI